MAASLFHSPLGPLGVQAGHPGGMKVCKDFYGFLKSVSGDVLHWALINLEDTCSSTPDMVESEETFLQSWSRLKVRVEAHAGDFCVSGDDDEAQVKTGVMAVKILDCLNMKLLNV
ncbi:hypothetical protein C0J50_20726 [Silurus asotus]|uniref:Uncharacterized protein n=1 Tax=Silurus asotus TaxID=30991 RepID=A0AAD5ANF5_SILAS|nr:hypothetical protein C0J50_20726 [Silurus asotus]